MFNAGLGQCGPKLPLLKSLLHVNKCSYQASFRPADCEAELQLIWQEIGEDVSQKLEEIRQTVSDAVSKIYDSALEDSMCQRAALQENVTKSENRLKELLGPDAAQVIAPEELPLNCRLRVNMRHLRDLNSTRVGPYGWIGGLVILVELRNKVAALREMLKLPPCDSSADIDQVIASATEALHDLSPGRIPKCKGEQKLIFQHLQSFYQTLCAMENACVESFSQKNEGGDSGCLYSAEISSRSELPNGRANVDKDEEARSESQHGVLFQGSENLVSPIPVSPVGCVTKRGSFKFMKKSRKLRNRKQYSEEASTLEQLSHKILNKLDNLNRHVRAADKFSENNRSFYSPSSQLDSECSSSPTIFSKTFHEVKPYSPMHSPSASPSSDEIKRADTPTSVLPETLQMTADPGFCINIGTASLIWPPEVLVNEKAEHTTSEHRDLLEQSTTFSCVWKRDYQTLNNAMQQDGICATSGNLEDTDSMKPLHLFADQNGVAMEKLQQVSYVPSIQSKQPLAATTNSQLSSNPLLSSKSAAPVAFPPPPPPPPPVGAWPLKPGKSTKLKRSATMGKLYIAIKKKVEGAEFVQSTPSDIALSHRTILGGGGVREGMAEALAEITRRSAYFRKIEVDIQHYASSVLEVKSALESFKTDDMETLLKFRKLLEAHLEKLTDESQVLARFQGFPFKKLETVRMAASLYSRLRATVQHIENWQVEPPASEQVGKITSFFEKVKMEVETIERTKDEDDKHFTEQSIYFSFEVITHIKEAMVDLSSSLSALALKESKNIRTSGNPRDGSSRPRLAFNTLWKAFQLSFRVYNFAGGQDERAEVLTCELANEMESYFSSGCRLRCSDNSGLH